MGGGGGEVKAFHDNFFSMNNQNSLCLLFICFKMVTGQKRLGYAQIDLL